MDDALNKSGNEILQLVTFSIGEENFGVDILKVQEIIRMMDITKVPRAPEFVEGVINLRGKVIPIIDLRRRFGRAPRPHDKDTRIIVIEMSGIIVGFVVDAVSEVLRIPKSTVEPAPPVLPSWNTGRRMGRPAMKPVRLVALLSLRIMSEYLVMEMP